MRKLFFILLAALTVGLYAGETQAPVKFRVGFGGGFEAGNGLRLGVKQGSETVELGLGLLYDAADANLRYSTGLRYLHDLYNGRLNDTYAWTGAGVFGRSRSGAGYVVSAGAGLGLALHFGLPFHFNLDSGWRLYYDTYPHLWGDSYKKIQTGPTINGALIYEW